MATDIPPTKIFHDHVKKLGGIFVDDQYLYTWGPGYIPERDSYPKDTVYIYDKERGFALDGMLLGHGQDIRCVASSTKYIFVGGGGGKDLTGYRYSVLVTYDKTTQLLRSDDGGDEYYAESLFNDGSYLFMGTSDGRIIVHELDSLREFMTIFPHNTKMSSTVLFADEVNVYSGGSTGNLIAWQKGKWKLQGRWPGHAKGMSRLIGDKTHLFSGDWGGEIIAWDLDIHAPRAKWSAHAGRVQGLALQGAHLFTCGGDDHLIKVWGADSFHELVVMQHHPASIIALVADETFLYAGYADGIVVAWEISQILDRAGGA